MQKLLVATSVLSLLACAAEPERTTPAPGETADAGAGTTDGVTMDISRSASRPPVQGPDDWFTGTATITPLFDPQGPSQVGAALVRFEPGTRTAWHKHPLGQRLVVTQGNGWTQVEGGPIEAIKVGDVVWCPPDVRHWHGATPNSAMAHIAIQEAENGSPVEWMEHVPDALYLSGPA